ncbi:MAG: c-type cytochrome [Gammaproteobacteria bacterium]|nr:c-type cytochrome [Gammaproteobacteria bacterium]
MKKLFVILMIGLSGLAGFLISLYKHPDAALPPHASDGDVQLIETFHSPAIFVKQLIGDPLAGEKIFREFCASCHAAEPLIDVPAPRINEKKAWAFRKKMGLPALLSITINGVGAMPARGGCFECSDAQLREAIVYILNSSEGKDAK